LHFIMLVKSWSPELIFYAVLIAGLLAFRLMARRPRADAARRPAQAGKRPLEVGPR